eukprot:6288178-Prymnesium_polylepis.1
MRIKCTILHSGDAPESGVQSAEPEAPRADPHAAFYRYHARCAQAHDQRSGDYETCQHPVAKN